jgi:hypothetical protein
MAEMQPRSRLAVIVGGKTLPAEDARALWEKFSAYMETHRNDFVGFARQEGWKFASVAAHQGVATLTLSNEPITSAAPKKRKRR